jgi:hypothetical protein
VLSYFFCLAACQGSPEPREASSDQLLQQKRLRHYRQEVLPRLNAEIQSGDLITRLGTDITSEMFRMMNLRDGSFSHCGIARIEHDTVFVYHAIGGEYNPDQVIKREPLFSFLHPEDCKAAGVFRPSVSAGRRQAIAEKAFAFFQSAIPFDMAFDFNTDNRLYCAEMVAKCISRSLADSSWLSFSQRGSMKYVGVDDLFLNPLMQRQFSLRY